MERCRGRRCCRRPPAAGGGGGGCRPRDVIWVPPPIPHPVKAARAQLPSPAAPSGCPPAAPESWLPAAAASMHPALYTRASMIREIAAAVAFISKFLRTKGLMNERQLQTFSQSLQELLAEHYKHHWFPEKPCKGSGYRCIRINHKMDPLIGQAAQRIGLSSQELFQLLPSELTLWVDPYEVSYRIGEDGSICVLYEAAPAGGSQNNTNMQMVDSRISCKEELLLGRTSPSKSYNMMTVSG